MDRNQGAHTRRVVIGAASSVTLAAALGVAAVQPAEAAGSITLAARQLQIHQGPASSSPAKNRYIALGDSYSSGQDAGSYLSGTATNTDTCHHSKFAYSQDIAHWRSSRFSPNTFRACSGAETYDLLHTNHKNKSEAAQPNAISSSTQTVTLTIGGNDAGFSTVLAACIKHAGAMKNFGCSSRSTVTTPLARRLSALAGKSSHTTPEHLQISSISSIIQKIHSKAPHARNYLAGYPHMFGVTKSHFKKDKSAPGGYSCQVHSNPLGAWVSYNDATWMNKEADALDTVIRNTAIAAHKKSIRAACVTPRFSGHGLCDSSSAWLNPLILSGLSANPASFHPTVSGQANGYGKAFYAAIS